MRRIKPIAHDDELSVVGHLDELRSRMMVALAAFLVAFRLTTWQSDLVLAIVNAPLPGDMQPITLGPAEPFITTLKNAAYAAILITLPVLLYQAYAFLVPALAPRERRLALPLLLMVPLLFVGGVVFCYLVVLPPALDFLLSFNSSEFNTQLRASDYYDFATLTMLAMGLGFQVPVGVLVLTRLGVVTVDKLRRSRSTSSASSWRGSSRRRRACGTKSRRPAERAGKHPVWHRRPGHTLRKATRKEQHGERAAGQEDRDPGRHRSRAGGARTAARGRRVGGGRGRSAVNRVRRDPGHEPRHRQGRQDPVDRLVSDASPDEYDGLLLPGGTVNADNLRQDEDVISFVQSIFRAGKPVGVICHGPWTLVEADLVRGRTLTSYPSIRTDIRNAGGNVVDEEVVTDQGLVSSRNPDDLPAFCAKVVEEFAEGEHEVHAEGATASGRAG